MMTAIYFLRSMQVRKRRMSSSELSEVWERIENTNRMSISHKAKPLYKLIIAASFALLIASSIFYVWERNKENNELFMIAQSIKPDSVVSDVQLVLANNEYISINNKKIDIQYDQKGNIHINDKKLKQENSATPQKEKDVALLHKINQLIVPKGRRSTLDVLRRYCALGKFRQSCSISGTIRGQTEGNIYRRRSIPASQSGQKPSFHCENKQNRY